MKRLFIGAVILILLTFAAYFLLSSEEVIITGTTTVPKTATTVEGATTTIAGATTVTGPTTTVTGATTTVPITTTTIALKVNEILIYPDRFEPSNMTMSAGEQVKWVNKDDKEHILVLSNPPIEKRVLAGSYFLLTFSSKGSVGFSDKDTGIAGTITIT